MTPDAPMPLPPAEAVPTEIAPPDRLPVATPQEVFISGQSMAPDQMILYGVIGMAAMYILMSRA